MSQKNNQIEKVISITIRWWSDEDKEIPTSHAEELEDEGKKRALQMMAEGYTSGELNHIVNTVAASPSNPSGWGVDYSGWFEITTESK
jgi:hypothetical protein